MKIRFVKDNEVVISREEYGELLKRAARLCEKDCQQFHREISRGTAKYECVDMQGCYFVVIGGEYCVYPIKKFNSDDIEYNRVCAEELCELLNQEQ